jgi:transposase, IS5 family
MDRQLSFASLDFAGKKKRTKRDVFLAEMVAVVPWSKLEALIETRKWACAHSGRHEWPCSRCHGDASSDP